MATRRQTTVAVLVPLGVASALVGWWVWGAEQRAAHQARLAHARGARAELAMYLEVGDSVARAVEYCRQARLRSVEVPRACREGEVGQAQLEKAQREAERAYLEACRRCAPPEACERDVRSLKAAGGKGSARLPCE